MHFSTCQFSLMPFFACFPDLSMQLTKVRLVSRRYLGVFMERRLDTSPSVCRSLLIPPPFPPSPPSTKSCLPFPSLKKKSYIVNVNGCYRTSFNFINGRFYARDTQAIFGCCAGVFQTSTSAHGFCSNDFAD